jgi:hypothetical protein
VSLCKLSGVKLCTLFGVREPAAAQSQGGNVFTTGDPLFRVRRNSAQSAS